MVKVKAIKPYFLGARYHTPADPPFEVDDGTAERLLKGGLVERYVPVAADLAEPESEVRTDPAPSRAARATGPVQRKRG